MNPEFICKVQKNGKIQPADAKRVKEIIEDGGLCILPSDSSYILTGQTEMQGVRNDLDILLERHELPMSLAFGSMELVTKIMHLSNKAYRFINQLTPRGLTFVADPRKTESVALSTRCLNADGTIGVRLTESLVETQLVEEYPLPSTPIRDSNYAEVVTAKESLHIIMDRISRLSKPRKIAVIDGVVPYPGRLSTVVKEEEYNAYSRIVIIRANAISIDEIRRVAAACQYEEVVV